MIITLSGPAFNTQFYEVKGHITTSSCPHTRDMGGVEKHGDSGGHP